jgi:hypothetical protein
MIHFYEIVSKNNPCKSVKSQTKYIVPMALEFFCLT